MRQTLAARMTLFRSDPGLFGLSWCAWCGQSFRSGLDDCPHCGRTRRWAQRVDGNTKKLSSLRKNRKAFTMAVAAQFVDQLSLSILEYINGALQDPTWTTESVATEAIVGLAVAFEGQGTRSLYMTGAEVGLALRMAVKDFQRASNV